MTVQAICGLTGSEGPNRPSPYPAIVPMEAHTPTATCAHSGTSLKLVVHIRVYHSVSQATCSGFRMMGLIRQASSARVRSSSRCSSPFSSPFMSPSDCSRAAASSWGLGASAAWTGPVSMATVVAPARSRDTDFLCFILASSISCVVGVYTPNHTTVLVESRAKSADSITWPQR